MVDRDLTPEEFATALGEMAPQLSKEGLLVSDEAASKLLGNIVPNVKAIKTSVTKGIKIQGGSLSALLAPFKLIGSGFKTSLKTFGVDIAKFTKDVKGTFKKLGDKLNIKKQISEAFSSRFKKLQDAIKKPFTSIRNAFSKVGNFFGFKSKEQREEEEAKNPAKFIIRYLKKNIEPLLKRIAGISGGVAEEGKSIFQRLLTGLGFGAGLAALLKYFDLDATAGQTLKQTIVSVLDEAFAVGGRLFKTLKNIFDDSFLSRLAKAVLGFTDDAAKAAGAAARTAAPVVDDIASASAKGAGAASSLTVGGAAGASRAVGVGVVPVSGSAEAKSLMDMIEETSKAAAKNENATRAAAGSGFLGKSIGKLLKSPLLSPVVEGVFAQADVRAIIAANNISEQAKQELIGKRIAQGVAAALAGPSGAAIGAYLGAHIPLPFGLGAILGAIGLGVGGDFAARYLIAQLGKDNNNFLNLGEAVYAANPALESANRAAIFGLEGENPDTGFPLSKMFNLKDVRDRPDLFVGGGLFGADLGGTGRLRDMLKSTADLAAMATSTKTQEAASPPAASESGPGVVIDNSQSNATEVNTFNAPGDTTPSNPDPVPESIGLSPALQGLLGGGSS